MKVYIDASVVLRRILSQPGAILDWSPWRLVVTSELLQVEAFRTLDPLRVKGSLREPDFAEKFAFLRSVTASFEEVPIHSAILRRAAAPYPTEVGALDAIHLATAMLWMEDNEEALTFISHDKQLALAARACGLEVLS